MEKSCIAFVLVLVFVFVFFWKMAQFFNGLLIVIFFLCSHDL